MWLVAAGCASGCVIGACTALGRISVELRKKFMGQSRLPDASRAGYVGWPLCQFSISTRLPVALKSAANCVTFFWMPQPASCLHVASKAAVGAVGLQSAGWPMLCAVTVVAAVADGIGTRSNSSMRACGVDSDYTELTTSPAQGPGASPWPSCAYPGRGRPRR
jgi:hypothetical protein